MLWAGSKRNLMTRDPSKKTEVLALDFDGVCCDGLHEYFETSRRVHARAWPTESMPGSELFGAFSALRPVILSGWEMPLLVRAIAQGRAHAAILSGWEKGGGAIDGEDAGGAVHRRLVGEAIGAVRG